MAKVKFIAGANLVEWKNADGIANSYRNFVADVDGTQYKLRVYEKQMDTKGLNLDNEDKVIARMNKMQWNVTPGEKDDTYGIHFVASIASDVEVEQITKLAEESKAREEARKAALEAVTF